MSIGAYCPPEPLLAEGCAVNASLKVECPATSSPASAHEAVSLPTATVRLAEHTHQINGLPATLCSGGALADMRLVVDGTNVEFFALRGLANMASFVTPPLGLARSGQVRIATSTLVQATATSTVGCVAPSVSVYRMGTIWRG